MRYGPGISSIHDVLFVVYIFVLGIVQIVAANLCWLGSLRTGSVYI